MSVSELLALSEALRLPPAALLFDITRPFGLSGSTDDEDRTPRGNASRVEQRQPALFPRNIDLIDWLNATETTVEADPELAHFEQRLEELDGVVVYPLGMTIQATYGRAGRKARAILTASRGAERALVRYEKARRDLLLFVRNLWNFQEERDKSDQVDAAMTAGRISGTAIGSALLGEVTEEERSAVDQVMRDFDAAAANLRDSQSQVRMAGGDPEVAPFAMSLRGVMGIVQNMPHEPIAVTVKRGRLADGVVDSPLRSYRTDEYESLRARFDLPPTQENDEGHGEHPETP